MNCAEFASAKHKLLDGELLDDQAREARAHGGECSACAAELQKTERVRSTLRASTLEELPPAVRVRLVGALLEAATRESEEAEPTDTGLTGPVLTLITADAIPGALAG
jgi:anti-sigma factor RsiW